MRGVAVLGEPTHAALFQAMHSTARRQSGLSNPPREVVAQPVLRSRLAVAGDDVSQVRLGHRVASGLQLGRHWNVHIGTTVRALDSDAPVLDVLRAEPNDLATTRHGF